MPSWDDFKPFIVLGLALGGVYAISGVGLVVLYRATGVVNLAYGAIGALGAFISWALINSVTSFNFPDALAYLVALVVGALTSLVYGVLIGSRLAQRDPLVKMIGSLGFALILLGLMTWKWNPLYAQILKLPTSNWTYGVGGVRVSWTQIMALGFGIVMTAAIALFLRVTKLGTAMRSLADNREITAMLGVPVRRVEATAWLGSGFLCGAAGLLLADLVGLSAAVLTFLVISSLAAALIGRLRSLWVTLAGAIVIGLVEACGTAFNGWAPYKTMTPFLIAIIALLWFGRRRVLTMGAATTTAPAGVTRAASRWAIWKQGEAVWGLDRGRFVSAGIAGAILLFMLAVFPVIVSHRWLLVFTTVPIYAVVALSGGFLYGRVGMISLGQVALFEAGAWIGLRLLWATGIPYPVVMLLTGLITMVLGILIGLPALRLSGIYLALITLMAAAAITLIFQVWSFPNGGGGFKGHNASTDFTPLPVRRPSFAGGDTAYYRFAMIAGALMFLLVIFYISGKSGRSWAAIRQSEPSALAGGVNITLYKLWAFALASFITGVAGATLAASGGGFIDTSSFSTVDSITLIAVVLMGGVYSVWGAVLAGVFLRVLPEFLQDWGVSAGWLLVLFGIGVIQVILTAPGGIVDQFPKDMANLGRLIGRAVGGVNGRRREAESKSKT